MAQRYCMKCMRPTGGTEVCPYCGYAGEGEHRSHILKPGTLLDGRYLLGEPLGQGGFGITYIGRDINLDIRVAVKEYYPNGYAVRNVETSDAISITDERLRRDVQKGKDSFLREARTLARFRGTPGIVDVLNFFEANDTAYIVMEYLEGETLGQRLKEKLFTADEIFRLMEPVLTTLEKVHRQGVVHRDISPDNIMMMPNGSLKLMDFGAARLMNYGDQRSVSVVLKAGYAPEEQYRTKGEQGPWTDIYALCATIYKCITGITPDDSLDRMTADEVKWPSQLGFPISMRQEAVLKKGMAIRQRDRFQSIGELKAALQTEASGSVDLGAITMEPRSKDETVAILSNQADLPEKGGVNAQAGGVQANGRVDPQKKEKANKASSPVAQAAMRRKTSDTRKASDTKKSILPWIVCAVLGVAVIAMALFILLGGKDNGARQTEAAVPSATPTPTPTPTKVPEVVFQNAAFEKAFRKKHDFSGVIYESDILAVTKLDLSKSNLSDISDIAMFKNLTELNLYDNQISDISALSGLTNLTVLNLRNNQISNISALSGMTKLAYLKLAYNQISNISALSRLTKLTDLSLVSNQISDISALSGMTKLTVLLLSDNQIRDISALKGLRNLEKLYLNRNQINNISALSGLTKLTGLWLGGNAISEQQIKDLRSKLPNCNVY